MKKTIIATLSARIVEFVKGYAIDPKADDDLYFAIVDDSNGELKKLVPTTASTKLINPKLAVLPVRRQQLEIIGNARGISAEMVATLLDRAKYNNEVDFNVEMRIVGEPLVDDNNDPIIDRNTGKPVVFAGDKFTKDEGAEYTVAVNILPQLSEAAKDRIEAFVINVDTQRTLSGKTNDFHTNRPYRQGRTMLSAGTSSNTSNETSTETKEEEEFIPPTKKQHESKEQYATRVTAAEAAWNEEQASKVIIGG